MDAITFKQLIEPLTDIIYRFARSMLQNEEEAKDAVQELSLKLYEKRKILDEVENFQAFAMKSIRNLCLDEIRKRRSNDELTENLHTNFSQPHQQLEETDMKWRIISLISKLPELQKTTIQLRDVEGYELEEIATIMGITTNAVMVNLSRARTKIREQIMNENKKVEKYIWK